MLKNLKQHDFLKSINNNYKIYFVFLIALGLSTRVYSLSAETIYKWIDINGFTHYGQMPPAPAVTAEINTLNIEDTLKSEASRTPSSIPDNTLEKAQEKRANGAERSNSTTQNLAPQCAVYREKLEYYISRLRAGYKAKQYNKLEGKRRSFRQKLWQYCR